MLYYHYDIYMLSVTDSFQFTGNMAAFDMNDPSAVVSPGILCNQAVVDTLYWPRH